MMIFPLSLTTMGSASLPDGDFAGMQKDETGCAQNSEFPRIVVDGENEAAQEAQNPIWLKSLSNLNPFQLAGLGADSSPNGPSEDTRFSFWCKPSEHALLAARTRYLSYLIDTE